MVVDTSAILAILFFDPGTEWAVAKLEEHATELRMSTVNLAETLADWSGRAVTGQAVVEASARLDRLAEGLAELETRWRPLADGSARWQALATAAVTSPLDEALAKVEAALPPLSLPGNGRHG